MNTIKSDLKSLNNAFVNLNDQSLYIIGGVEIKTDQENIYTLYQSWQLQNLIKFKKSYNEWYIGQPYNYTGF